MGYDYIYPRWDSRRGVSMDAETLLQLTPELLAKALIHRHERLIDELPDQIKSFQDDLDSAKPMAETARKKRDDLNAKVASLKKERNNCTSRASKIRNSASEMRKQAISSAASARGVMRVIRYDFVIALSLWILFDMLPSRL